MTTRCASGCSALSSPGCSRHRGHAFIKVGKVCFGSKPEELILRNFVRFAREADVAADVRLLRLRATNGHVKLCTQSRLAEIDCRAFRPLLVWSVTPSEAKQIQNCCQNPWIASSPCGLAMAVGDPTKIGTPCASLLAVVDRLVMRLGFGSGATAASRTTGAPRLRSRHFGSRVGTRRQRPGPQSPISPSWRARELFFSLRSPSMDAANHRWLVQTHSRARRRQRQAAPDRTLTVPLCGLPRDAAAASYRTAATSSQLSSTLRQGVGHLTELPLWGQPADICVRFAECPLLLPRAAIGWLVTAHPKFPAARSRCDGRE